MAEVLGGYQPDTRSESSRRADFDLRRRITREIAESGGGGGGTGTDEVWIGPGAPPDSATELWFDSDAESVGGAGGTMILDGVGPPTDVVGEIGNYYLDTDGDALYGPKSEGAGSDHEAVIPGMGTPNAPNFTLGVKFKVTEECQATGVHFEVAAADTGLTGWRISIHRKSDQVRLATKVTPVVTGHNRISFDVPVTLLPDVIYISSVYNPANTAFLYAQAYTGPIDSGPIHILRNDEDGAATGTYSSGDAYPGTDWSATLIGSPTPMVYVGAPAWSVALVGVPRGGTTGQVLRKTGNADFAMAWAS
jgi:hypothetical protein